MILAFKNYIDYAAWILVCGASGAFVLCSFYTIAALHVVEHEIKESLSFKRKKRGLL